MFAGQEGQLCPLFSELKELSDSLYYIAVQNNSK